MRICVTNRNLCSGDFFETVSKACQTADMVILREKDMSSTEYEKTAETVQKICKDNDTLFCINTFSDIAEKIKPDALQLSYNDFIKYTKKEILTGVSVHSLSEALSAEKYGADFLIAGHIFETDCKKGLAPRGEKFLTKIVSNVEIPVYAIGGINPENESEVYKWGADGVCIMSGYMR